MRTKENPHSALATRAGAEKVDRSSEKRIGTYYPLGCNESLERVSSNGGEVRL